MRREESDGESPETVLPFFGGSLQPLVLYNSRSPRPGEKDGVDYAFRRREEIETLRHDERYVVMDVRGDLQALDMPELTATLEHGDVFFKGNPAVGRLLQTHPALEEIDRLSLFMSPLSREEIVFLKGVRPTVSMPSLVTDIMRRRLLRRTRKQKGGDVSGRPGKH